MRMCLFVSTAVDGDKDVQQGDTKHDDLTGTGRHGHRETEDLSNYYTLIVYTVGYYQSIVSLYC